MWIPFNVLRFFIQFLLLLTYGKYLEEVVSLSFLLIGYFFSQVLAALLSSYRFRTASALFFLGLWPWGVRLIIILIQIIEPSFLQLSFDMNFYFVLIPVYLFSMLTWFSLVFSPFRKYEVLLNGILLSLLFYSQGDYKVTLFSNPLWLALYGILFLLIELLILYMAVASEKSIIKKPADVIRETVLFFLLLLPLAIFILLPLWKQYEEDSVAGGGGLLKSSLFRFDFSEYIKLETEISMSDDLVLMFRKEGPAERLLLRRYVLSGYEDGQGFYRHDLDKTNPPDTVPTRYAEYEDPDYRNRDSVKQELFLVNIDPTAFLSLNYPVNVQPVYNWDDSSFVRIYQSEAMVNSANIREIDPSVYMDPDDTVHYTYHGSNGALEKLALEITENIPGSLLKVAAIERYFHENYYYSLKPGVAPDGDQLSWFLEETKKGYCSYFAFSMALLCRSIGIPARVAVGFWVDPDVSVLNFYPARADQAHAWVEVFFEEYGWVEYDPTSSTMYPGEQYPFAGFTIDEFSPLIEEILDNELVPENLAEMDKSSNPDEPEKPVGEIVLGFVKRFWIPLVALIYLVSLLFYHYSRRLFFIFRKSNRRKGEDLYREIRHLLSFEKKAYRETVSDYAGKVEKRWNIPFRTLTEIYQKSLFSEKFDNEDLQEMLVQRRITIRAYRKSLTVGRRFLHFLMPFWRSL